MAEGASIGFKKRKTVVEKCETADAGTGSTGSVNSGSSGTSAFLVPPVPLTVVIKSEPNTAPASTAVVKEAAEVPSAAPIVMKIGNMSGGGGGAKRKFRVRAPSP